jgi:hypothetical protein
MRQKMAIDLLDIIAVIGCINAQEKAWFLKTSQIG